MKTFRLIIALIIIGFAFSCQELVQKQIDEHAVMGAEDEIKQYMIAKEAGDHNRAYIGALMVAEFYLQAKETKLYNKWNEIAAKHHTELMNEANIY